MIIPPEKTIGESVFESKLGLLLLENDEFVADEIPGETGDAPESGTDERPLGDIESGYRRDGNEHVGREEIIDEESDETHEEELRELGCIRLLFRSGKGPVFVPDETVDVGDDEGERLVEGVDGDGEDHRVEDDEVRLGPEKIPEEGHDGGENADIDKGIEASDEDELGDLPDDRNTTADDRRGENSSGGGDDEKGEDGEPNIGKEFRLGGGEYGEREKTDEDSRGQTEFIVLPGRERRCFL